MFGKKTVILMMLFVSSCAYSGFWGNVHGIDCDKAKSRTDRQVCADPELMRLDARMTKAYKKLKKNLPTQAYKDLLARRQRIWLKDRAEIPCMSDSSEKERVKCLRRAYEYRIKRLEGWNGDNRYDFYIDYELAGNAGYRFVSGNGEAIRVMFAPDRPVLGYSFPEAQEELILCGESFITLGMTSRIMEKNADRVVFWAGRAMEDAEGRRRDTGPEKYSEASCPRLEIKSYPIRFFSRDEMTAVYEEARSRPLKWKEPLDEEARKRSEKICRPALDVLREGRAVPLYPDTVANSFRELEEKTGLKCSQDTLRGRVLRSYKWYPPYLVYDAGGGEYLFAGIFSERMAQKRLRYILVDKNCVRQEKGAEHYPWGVIDPVVLRDGEDFYVLYKHEARFLIEKFSEGGTCWFYHEKDSKK